MREHDLRHSIDSEKENSRKIVPSKTLISREVFVQQDRKKSRMHTNSILNELRLNQKINQDDLLLQQQKSLNRFQNCRKNSIRLNTINRSSLINLNTHETFPSVRQSNFFEPTSQKCNGFLFSNLNDERVNNIQIQNRKLQQQKEETIKQKFRNNKRFKIHQFSDKNKKRQKKPNNTILSSINTKLRQISIISRTFDKVNDSYCLQSSIAGQKYNQKSTQTDKILRDFESKLTLRKNLITERKNSLKKNIKLQYMYKVMTKRYQTQIQNQISDYQNNHNLNIQSASFQKYKGVWHQDARKLKNYIRGGYSDQKQEYSDFCYVEQYRELKRNFQTFQQIYNSIREDKDNPISKVMKHQLEKPNVLELVSVMQKQQQLETLNSN